jgi:hypothetical protein
MNSQSTKQNRKWIWTAVIVLAVLHQDFWLWDNRSLVFGFLPIGLAYHMLFSIMAAVVWACALKFAWPEEWQAWADEVQSTAPRSEEVRK